MAKPDVGGTGNLEQNPKVGEQVHGGFRSNRHHEAMEQMADERGMGRDILRQTEDAYPNEILTQGNAEMMASVEPVGKNSVKVSPWSK